MSTINDNLLNGQTINDWLLNGGSDGGGGGGLTTAQVQALIDAAGHLSSVDAQALIDAADHLNAAEVQALIDASSGSGGYCPTVAVTSGAVSQGIDVGVTYTLTGSALDSVSSAALIPVGIGGIVTAVVGVQQQFASMELTVTTDAADGVYDLHLSSSCGAPIVVVPNWLVVSAIIVPGSAVTPWVDVQDGVVVGEGTLLAAFLNLGAMFSSIDANQDFGLMWDDATNAVNTYVGFDNSPTWVDGGLQAGFTVAVRRFGATAKIMFLNGVQMGSFNVIATDTTILKRVNNVLTVHINDGDNPPSFTFPAPVPDAGFFKVSSNTSNKTIIDISLVKG